MYMLQEKQQQINEQQQEACFVCREKKNKETNMKIKSIMMITKTTE